jgi:RNA polymerase sigma-70 factor (ECF subfamily)
VASPNDPLARCTDEELLGRLRDGERDVFGHLVRRYERELYGYLRRYLGDDELAADVFQNTFLAVFTKIAQYEPGRPGRPWLYAIATNQAIDALRRKGRRAERTVDPLAPTAGEAADNGRPLFDLLAAKDADPADLADAAETRRRVRAAVDDLPDLLRQVVVLAYFQGLKYQEVADALDIPVGTVKSRLHAAVAKLAAAWEQVESEETRE